MKNKRLISIITLITALSLACTAQEKKIIQGYSGGMMVHAGYLSGCDNPFDYNAAGKTLGIGGAAKINFGKHFRAGFEGYVSTMGLKKDIAEGSFNKVFWTGLLGDFIWKAGRFYPFAGCTFGGGMETSYYMFQGNKQDWAPEETAVFRKSPFFAIDPFAGVEYALGESLRLQLKADFLFAINSSGLNKPMGPRLYLGLVFAH